MGGSGTDRGILSAQKFLGFHGPRHDFGVEVFMDDLAPACEAKVLGQD